MMDMEPKKVVIVNREDEVIGALDIDAARKQKAIRRIARVFLFDAAGRIFLQHRSKNQMIFPDVWDAAAGGHVDEGEGYEDAARRELYEEIGLSPDTPMHLLTTYYSEENTNIGPAWLWNGIFVAEYGGESIRYDQHEVSDGKWITTDELDHLIQASPDQLSPGLIRAWEVYKKSV